MIWSVAEPTEHQLVLFSSIATLFAGLAVEAFPVGLVHGVDLV